MGQISGHRPWQKRPSELHNVRTQSSEYHSGTVGLNFLVHVSAVEQAKLLGCNIGREEERWSMTSCIICCGSVTTKKAYLANLFVLATSSLNLF